MKKYIAFLTIMQLLLMIAASYSGCSKKNDKPEENKNDTWDIDKDGIPRFVIFNYIELDKINRISKFRSSQGHDYSDAFEHCRSMKHYYEPKGTVDWTSIKIYSPVTGKLTRVEEEWAGTKLEIASDDYPAFRFSVFHINLSKQRNLDEQVMAGELLGTHIGLETWSDISVIVNDPTRQGRMVSYFDVMTDSVFNEYRLRGVNSREDLIIPKRVRDANPLTCSGDTFMGIDTIENWVILN